MGLATFYRVSFSRQPVPVRDASLTPSRRLFPLACVVLLGGGLSLAAFFLVRMEERERVEQEFEWRARSHMVALRTNLERFEECLYTLRDIFQSSTNVTYAKFRRTAEDVRQRHRGVQALQWLPFVKDSERADFEARARNAAALADYQIVERDSKNTGNAPAGAHAEYAPVLYVDPREGNEDVFGLDSYGGPHQQALLRARDTGAMTATPRLQLREPTGQEYGWVYLLACYGKGSEPDSNQDRRERLQGYVAGTFRLSDWMINSFTGTANPAVEALVIDQTAGVTEPFLVAYTGGVRTVPSAGSWDLRSGLRHAEILRVGGREWCVYFRPSAAWLAAQSTPYPYAALVGGLLMTGLVGYLVHNTQRRARLVSRLVEERTAELHATQESLRKDIGRRELVETALRRSDDRYRAFVEQSTEGIWCYECDPPISTHLPVDEQIELLYRDARLAECNDAMARMYGYDRSEQITGARLEVFAPRATPESLEYFRAFIGNGYRITEWETCEVDQNGRKRFFLNHQTGIVEDDLLQRAWGTQRDITERKREAELQFQQATRLRLAVSAAKLGTWDWDLVAKRVIWSPETERIFGLEPGTFDGTLATYMSFLHPEDRERVGLIIRHAMETPGETGTDYELRIYRSDGTMRWLVARGAVLGDAQGRPARMIGTVMDVTAQHLADEERLRMERKLQESQKLESLGILAGGIAHDFNNLLTGVLGNASFARMDIPANSPAQASLEQVEVAALRAAELCKQMLAYSGKGCFIVQQLDLSQVVRETADLLHVSIGKSSALKYALATNLPAISADATQVRQIIMNLITNASEAIGDRSGVISIATGVMRADRAYLTEAFLSPNIPEGDYVFLEVSDNGSGMDAATRAKIFDPFFTTKFTGRGLGLAAVLGIVRGHHGALKVYSEPGQGTTFKLLLPCVDGPAEAAPELPFGDSTWRGSGTVLVVDDEETVRAMTSRMLKRIGFEVLVAKDGVEALEIFHRESARIVGVLLDLTMPVLDGNAAFTELRRLDSEVRVLLMSGFNEQDAVHRFAGKGLAGFIQKPFKPETLYEKMQGILAQEGVAVRV